MGDHPARRLGEDLTTLRCKNCMLRNFTQGVSDLEELFGKLPENITNSTENS
jgi:hypothetical protein